MRTAMLNQGQCCVYDNAKTYYNAKSVAVLSLRECGLGVCSWCVLVLSLRGIEWASQTLQPNSTKIFFQWGTLRC